MAKATKPETKLGQPAKYGKLLAGHDTPLGIAAVKAATAACPPGKTHPRARHKSWTEKPKSEH